jgi:hypothetical protein
MRHSDKSGVALFYFRHKPNFLRNFSRLLAELQHAGTNGAARPQYAIVPNINNQT